MTSPSHWSIRTVLVWLVLASLLPGVAGASFLFIYQYYEGRAQLEEDTIGTARALVQAVDSYLFRVQALGEALATADSLTKGDLAQFHARARKVVDTSRLVANVVLRDRNERLVLNALIKPGDPLPQQPSREHVRRVFSTGTPSISGLYRVGQFPHPIISVDIPVVINGDVKYSLGLSVFPEHLNKILRLQNLPQGWVAAILDGNATIVARNITPEKFLGNRATPQLLSAMQRSWEGSVAAVSQEGIAVQTAYSRSTATNWGVAIGIPRQSLQQAMVLSLTRLATGVVALFIIGLAMAWLIGGRIARSVKELTVHATALGRGETVQAPSFHLKETAQVGDALVHAAGLLQERDAALCAKETELAQAHTRLREVIDSAPALIYLKDLEGRFLLVNKTYEKLIGTNAPTGKMPGQALSKWPHSQGPSAADLKVLQTADVVHIEEEIDTVEGKKHFAISKAPLRDHAGHMIGICAAAVDITSLKTAEAEISNLVATLEKRVVERTEDLRIANMQLLETNNQLQEANSQLEAFSYTVAHDLRAPLRGIQGFADALTEDCHDKLNESGRDYLQRISRAAGRMEQLINDLLAFGRMSRMELVPRAVELDDVLKQALVNLDAGIKQSNARIEIATRLPRVYANATACLQIFQNLISNAIKFARPDVSARVRIWAERRNVEQIATEVVRIWVEDNGIGIPAAQQQRVFMAFERLHGMSEYPGSGIGLAIVDVAARRMRGSCGVKSEMNVGSRFWVELPAPPVEK